MRLLETGFKDKKFDDCPIPFKAIATDVSNGDEIIMENGSLSSAIRASISLPLIFAPVKVENRILMDGGFANPVPADVVRGMGADVVIAVDVSWCARARDAPGAMGQYGRSGRYAILAEELDAADIVVAPRTARTRMLDFDHKETNIAAGEAAGREAVPQLREAIARVGSAKRSLRTRATDSTRPDAISATRRVIELN